MTDRATSPTAAILILAKLEIFSESAPAKDSRKLISHSRRRTKTSRHLNLLRDESTNNGGRHCLQAISLSSYFERVRPTLPPLYATACSAAKTLPRSLLETRIGASTRSASLSILSLWLE